MTLQHAPVLQSIKHHLVKLGPNAALVRAALKAKARVHGFRLTFSDAAITIRRGGQALSLPFSHFVEVPITLECFDDFFRSVEPQQREGLLVLDFSTPGLHVYRRGGIAFHFPGVPEEDSMDAYTHWYRPRPGDVVWDAGAHAGATTYFLSQAVGDAGRVYAFEPDEVSFEFLLRNIAAHKLTNVIPVNKALTDKTGTVTFQSDGTLSAGIKDYLLYADRGTSVKVPAISLPDACEEFGGVPNYVKMDIEGAELAVIEGAREFLKRHPIHFAIESYHPMDGDFTYKALDRIFPTLGYEVESSAQFGQMFTWARA